MYPSNPNYQELNPTSSFYTEINFLKIKIGRFKILDDIETNYFFTIHKA